MTTPLQRHKVWDITTRIFHWVNAITVITLLAIGLLILNTKTFGIEGDAKILLKSLHVYVGYIFVINLVWRFVWGFIGGHYSRWKQILPWGQGYFHSLKDYLCHLRSGKPQTYLGHNPAGKLVVGLFFLLLTSQAITGLVIAGTDLFYPPFGSYFAEWVTEGDAERLQQLKPGDKSQVVETAYQEMRDFRKPFIETHEIGFFILLFLVLLHIAGVVVAELKEKNGLISAMITGEKVIDSEPLDKQE